MRATLIVVGSHSHSRAVGIALGGIATRILHEAPVAVLVARTAADPDAFPAHVVVGADGSRASRGGSRGGPPVPAARTTARAADDVAC